LIDVISKTHDDAKRTAVYVPFRMLYYQFSVTKYYEFLQDSTIIIIGKVEPCVANRTMGASQLLYKGRLFWGKDGQLV